MRRVSHYEQVLEVGDHARPCRGAYFHKIGVIRRLWKDRDNNYRKMADVEFDGVIVPVELRYLQYRGW